MSAYTYGDPIFASNFTYWRRGCRKQYAFEGILKEACKTH